MRRPATAAASVQNPLVFMQTDEGFKVYAPSNPKASFLVNGTADAPSCTCPDFQHGADGFRCAHIRAVEKLLPASSDAEEAAYAREERLAIQEEANVPVHAGQAAGLPLPRAQMMIKRSVSRDGRIDSMSVEFTRIVNGEKDDELHVLAERIIGLQEGIVGEFVTDQNKGGDDSSGGEESSAEDDAVDAKLVNIEGMNTRQGWSLFLNVLVDGETVKFFGKHNDLADAIRDAGYPAAAKKRIAQGVKLNLKCRVVTSQKGKYTVVDRFLPQAGNTQ